MTRAEVMLLSPEDDSIEMDCLKGNVEDWRDIIFPALNSLPECPSLKILKREINTFISSLWVKRRDFVIASLELHRFQTLATQYIIEAGHIGKSRSSRADPTAYPLDELKEIENPKEGTEARSMVLFKVLRNHPDKAINTDKAMALLEAAEGKPVKKEPTLRAMKLLPRLYSLITSEKINNKFRIRFKTLPKPIVTGCDDNFDFKESSQGVTEDREYRDKGDD